MIATQIKIPVVAMQNRLDDLECAKMAAKKFLEQSHPIIIFKDVYLDGNAWTAVIDIGPIDEHLIYLRIDAKTDRVLTCLCR